MTPPRQLDPEYPADLDAIVMKGLAANRNDRYPTAAAFQEDLETFARRAGLHFNDHAMARLMSKLFASELEPWERARETGISLDKFLIQEVRRTLDQLPRAHDSIEERTTKPRARRRRLSRRQRMAIAITIVATLFGAAYLFTRWVLADPPSLKAATPSG